MTARLALLREAGILSALDVHFARAVARMGGEQDADVVLAAALASRTVRDGHVCMTLGADVAAGDPVWSAPELRRVVPDVAAWREALTRSPLVSDGTRATPLVLDHAGRLYLRRYFHHEQSLVNQVGVRASRVMTDVDAPLLREGLDRLFGPADAAAPELQRLAALTAVRRGLCVVSGGPGTGKTYTVVKILALLVEQAVAASRPLPRMILAAPTGKAAARLMESIRGAKASLACEDPVRDAIAEDAATIHRVLGSQRGSSTEFVHGADHKLVADVVLVDEASMVDVGLMARLVAAVPDQARLILLGDKDQLASVEAGAALGDICNTGGARHYSTSHVRDLAELTGEAMVPESGAPDTTGVWDCIVHLTRSHRYAPDSGIRRLADAINAGDSSAALAVLRDDAFPDAVLRPSVDDDALEPSLAQAAVAGFEPYLTAAGPADALRALAGFRILCGHRTGVAGVASVNAAVRKLLRARGLVAGYEDTYAGRPIMVTANSYELRLFNGDVGLIARTPEGGLRAFFIAPDGRERVFAPSRLPPHETVFAMTVHKSQGSEFERVAVVLPDHASRVVSRELIYTAVTRARSHVTIHASEEVVAASIARRVERASGLRDALWGR